MGGVVFAGNVDDTSALGMFGTRTAIPAGVVPPGQWYLTQAAALVSTGGNIAIPAGSLVVSDGRNVTTAAAGFGVTVGARASPPSWPWKQPWPLVGINATTGEPEQMEGETPEDFKARQEDHQRKQQARQKHEQEQQAQHGQQAQHNNRRGEHG